MYLSSVQILREQRTAAAHRLPGRKSQHRTAARSIFGLEFKSFYSGYWNQNMTIYRRARDGHDAYFFSVISNIRRRRRRLDM